MQSFIASYLLKNRAKLLEEWGKEWAKLRSESDLLTQPDDAFEHTNKKLMELVLSTAEGHKDSYYAELKEHVDRFIQNGGSLILFSKSMHLFRKVCQRFVLASDLKESQAVEMLAELNEWIDERTDRIVNDYAGNWEHTIEMQKLSLLELSAPLIPVFEGITVMPLIGTIDTARAKLIMENLLEGVIEHRSKVVLIDITGVPVVDTMVAQHIIEASEAVRLIGAKAVLVGIRPEIAQTIVNLGIDLARFPTQSTLRKGVVLALEMTGKKVVDL
ncbi:positive regulator of sigma-B activity [Niallia circulans]|jgi:rsbT co-antagonist protein RsbR|uniref:RsbT co-antagonist protein RsbRA n=1 Tax=Shouchella clausii TaxID=79880 RepID=UPI000B9626A4|nr:RsbT co-antagonist protein RsbRA [Shouchella clausii]PAD41524.1 RsbT co-antagonist protein RsbRA [Bacillus sp. 7520-S]SPU21191.1 positive regulator of sigma-B activity [Niallia circulans]AST94872.1 RsbT co-antagonist protein RsbRA [Shouchella clausii]MCR1290016.1 RsbT co-antagonist protein RsbRA [Shouchella clausii]MEB5473359.1 RsbT co-antagonist protein RsbRA [Shouchella clausii]